MGIGSSGRPSRTVPTSSGNGNFYKYPPKTENYFAQYFIMGGERFEGAKSDAYLFGENEDLNFLGSKPSQFPYAVPQTHEATRALKSLVNIRRDSVRFVKDVDGMNDSTNNDASHTRYNIEFTFDTDVKCAVTIYYFAKEEIKNKQVIYHPQDPDMNSETFHYKKGANQTFSQPTHFIDPSKFNEDDWKYSTESEVIPVVIHCVVEEPDHDGHSHVTFAVMEKSLDGGFSLKALKQKQMVDGLCYLLQEVYGIENKNAQRSRQEDEDIEDNGSECVICMSETRDTLILPCRHLCLCNSCADNLRYQANNCPICRAKFHALLQIKALRRRTSTVASTETSDENLLNHNGVLPGYEAISLIEALNGPTQPHCACSVPTLPSDATMQSLSNATDTIPESEAGLQKENGDAKTLKSGDEDSLELPVDYSLDSSIYDETENQENSTEKKTEEKTNAQSSVICSSPKVTHLDTSIPISDDEESNDLSPSGYATPLHQSRVLPRSVETRSPESAVSNGVGNPEPADNGKLRICTGYHDDSKYSSSSSVRELLGRGNPADAQSEAQAQGIVGCAEDIEVEVV